MRRGRTEEHHDRPRAPARGARARLAGALALLLAHGCKDPPEELGAYERHPGAGCGDLASECVDESTLWACVDRRWELVDCIAKCEKRGGLVGCLESPEVPTEGRCWCRDDAAACVPGQAECASGDVAQVCDPETLEFMELSCEAECAAMDPPQLSLGCKAGQCSCTLRGTPCASESPPRCDDVFSLARCVDGVWDVEGCLSNCDPWAPGGAACGRAG